MCGITGIFVTEKSNYHVNEDLLKKMRDKMIHRGPDDAGIFISPDRKLGLAHRRLSIIDLTSSAHQPMANEDNTIWIVFNGEIYNFLELKESLIRKGHKFKSRSDTEVILHLYEEYSQEFVKFLRGMFAIAIWDSVKKWLILVRDRIGIKPLYYTYQNGRFIFASEIKAILADPSISPEINEEAFYHYLSFLTTPAPLTMFKNIFKLPPATILMVKKNGDIKFSKYWKIFENVKLLKNHNEKHVAFELIDKLKESVKYRMISDVPVGVFLSGGIDSSLNAVLFSEISNEPVRTFTIGYKGKFDSYTNEFGYARKIAKQISAIQFEIFLSQNDLLNFLPKLIYYQDEPIADPVCIPIYYLSKLAAENGVKVVQVGEGSDELFMGYKNWKPLYILQKLNEIFLIRLIEKMLLPIFGKFENKFLYEYLKRGSVDQPIFWGGAEAFSENLKNKIISIKLRKKFKNFSSFEIIKKYYHEFLQVTPERSPMNWMTYLDLNLRLPELLLMRVDKMTMAASIESRVPFLDHEFVEFVLSIPVKIRIRNLQYKYILKEAAKAYLPGYILNRKKQGFSVPIHDWLFDELGYYVEKKILKFVKETHFFDEKFVSSFLVKSRSSLTWYILNFTLWYEKYILGNKEI